jgi:hypothetical protein
MALSEAEKEELAALRKASKQDSGEPGFGEKVGALAYGGVTGLAGGLGELEKFAAYDVPEFLGFREEGKRDKMMGRETIFPTVKEAEQVLGKVGIQKPREEVSGYQTAGEILGGFGTSLPGLARTGAKALLGKPSVTSEAYAKAAEKLGFKLSPAQVRQDIPVPSKGATGFSEQNQSLANKLVSAATGKEAKEISPTFIRDRLTDLGKQFDEVYKGKEFVIDQDAVSALRSLANNEMQLPINAQVNSVKNTAKTIVDNFDMLSRGPGAKPSTFSIEGDALQRIRNDLMAGARSAQRQDAHQIYELVDIIDKSVAKSNPQAAAKLAEIRPLYRNTVVLEDLTAQNGVRQGNVSLERLGDMLAARKGGVRRAETYDIDRLGELGKELNLRARWQTEGRAATAGEDILGKALGTGADIASTLTGMRTRPARATQRYYAGRPEEVRKLGPGVANVPAGVAAGTITRPFQGEEE